MVTRLLICGGREFNDYEALDRAMKALPWTPEIIIQGGARGADALAKLWAEKHAVHCAEVPAMWRTFNKSAGNLRNRAMLLLAPEYCIALPGGPGTKDMVSQCKKANIPVWEPYPS